MKLSKLAAVVALAVLPSIGYAQQIEGTGWSVTADVGYNQHAIDVEGGYEEETGKDTAPSVGVSYKFQDFWSVQLQYADTGKADLFSFNQGSAKYTFSSETSQLNVFGAFSTDRQIGNWGFGGRLGLSKWDTSMFIAGTNGSISQEAELDNDSGISLIGGISTFYVINNNIDLTFSADWSVTEPDIEVIEGQNTEIQYSRYAVGLAYHF
jgi:hypothetical protein